MCNPVCNSWYRQPHPKHTHTSFDQSPGITSSLGSHEMQSYSKTHHQTEPESTDAEAETCRTSEASQARSASHTRHDTTPQTHTPHNICPSGHTPASYAKHSEHHVYCVCIYKRLTYSAITLKQEKERMRDRTTDRQTRQTDRQTDRQTNTDRQIQTDRQTNRYRQIQTDK